MTYNRITLTFTDGNETRFLKSYFSDSIFQFRIAFLLVTFLYGVFGYLDSRVIPEYIELFDFIRFAVVVPLLFFVFLISYTKIFQKTWQPLLVLCALVGGIGICLMIILVPDNYAYSAGMMLIFSAVYFFIKLRFFLASISCWSLVIIYNIGAIYFSDTPTLILLNNNFFFISANIIGMAAAYNIEHYARYNFFLNSKLESEKEKIEKINLNLEKTVYERTIELKKAKDKAEESDRLKSAFLANMSHEIRTPMNSILGFSDLLKNPELTGAEQQDFISFIESSGERMLNIINDIIDISKIEAGLMNVEFSNININNIVENTYHAFRHEVEAKGMKLSFKTSLPEEKSIIYSDQEKVYALLTNLVKNAIKYSNEGEIEFGYTKINDFLHFYVKDTGIGIPKDRQSTIFERFIQADILDSQARQGAGLGLSISKAYIDMLGGQIWVESKPEKGSTFYFTLPHKES